VFTHRLRTCQLEETSGRATFGKKKVVMQSEGQRRRPWNVSLLTFDSIVRKVLSRLIVTDSPAHLPQSSSSPSDRHAVYQRRSFSTLVPENRSVMLFSEAGKRVGHVCVCFDGKLVIWGGYNVCQRVIVILHKCTDCLCSDRMSDSAFPAATTRPTNCGFSILS
jgi:hypothetical protein